MLLLTHIVLKTMRYGAVNACYCYGWGHLLIFEEDEADSQICAQASILTASVIIFSSDNSIELFAPDLNDRVPGLSFW